jgi:hypothetical protein
MNGATCTHLIPITMTTSIYIWCGLKEKLGGKIMTSILPPTTWSEEDTIIWENMDAPTKREFVLSSAFADVRKKPSEWLNEKLGETK